MNKGELIDAIVKDTKLVKKDVEAVVNSYMTVSVKAAKKEGLTLVGYGSLNVVKTKARMGVNPRTGEKLKIKAGKKLKFKASKTLKL